MPAPAQPSPPAVSLLLAAHDATDTDLQCTLHAVLAQNLYDCEILLLLPPGRSGGDLGLTGALPARLQVLTCPAPGLAAAWNLGLQHAAGEYLAFLSTDCMLHHCYALQLYTLALFEGADLCHGEYALPTTPYRVCSCYGALTAGAGSALLCLGPLWTFLFARRFVEERQLRFNEDCAGAAGTVFLVQALLECRVMAPCEAVVGLHAGGAAAALPPGELEQSLAGLRAAAELICARLGTQPAAALAYALAWLLRMPLLQLAERAGPGRADACRALAAQLQAVCPPPLRKLLDQQLDCWNEARAAHRPPWYRLDFKFEFYSRLIAGGKLKQVHRRMLEELQAQAGDDCDDVYLLLMHLGDAYAVLCFLSVLIRTHASRRPVIAVCSPGMAELVAMTRPQLPVIVLPPELKTVFENLAVQQLHLGRWRILVYYNVYIFNVHMLRPMFVSGDVRRETKLQCYARRYGCRVSDIDIPPLCLPEAARERALEVARRHHLATERLVMLFPETYTPAELPVWEDFWLPLMRQLLERGCSLYVNFTRQPEHALPEEACRFELSVAEVCALAFEARRIIAQRSGLIELLAQGPAMLDVIYTSQPLAHHTLMQYPHVSTKQLREYELPQLGVQRCLELLLERPMP